MSNLMIVSRIVENHASLTLKSMNRKLSNFRVYYLEPNFFKLFVLVYRFELNCRNLCIVPLGS